MNVTYHEQRALSCALYVLPSDPVWRVKMAHIRVCEGRLA